MTDTVIETHEPDRKVKIIKQDDSSVEGRVIASSEVGYLLKTKGGGAGTFIATSDIKNVSLAEEEAELKQVVLKNIKPAGVKRHLLDRHGLTLSYVNGLTEDQAVQVHNDLHVGENAAEIGHRHEGD